MEEEEETNDINIALRTRSHVKIDDSVLNDNFLPDVDMNLYQNPGSEQNDPDYNNFLNRLYSDELGQDTNTDDNDTEYVYNNDIYSHGWTFDLNEVQEFKSSEVAKSDEPARFNNLNDCEDILTLASAETNIKTPWQSKDSFADPEFARILNQQLRQHIQLLAQTYILTKNAANLRSASQEVEEHLQSCMKIFKDRTKPSNLLPTLNLIKNYTTKDQLRPSVRFTWRHLPLPEPIKKIIKDNPNVFIYSNLLPQVSYSFLERPKTKPEKPLAPTKDTFTLNEDKLLTYALHEFRGEAAKYHLISTLLMTTKTKKQIINHVKNIKRSSATNNPIKLYFERGNLPAIDQETDSAICDKSSTATITVKESTSITGEEEEVIGVDEQEQEQEKDRDNIISSPARQEEKSSSSSSPSPSKEESLESEVEATCSHVAEINAHECPAQPELLTEQSVEQDNCFDVDHEDSNHQNNRFPMMARVSAVELELGEKNIECDNIMDMDLDDLVAASSTISKQTYSNNINNSENKYIRNLKLRKSMLNLMSHNFVFSESLGNLIIEGFLSSAKQNLNERHYLHLLQLLADLDKSDKDVESVYQEIIRFLTKIDAPQEFHERVVLFLNLEQATKCGSAMSYLHWMRFFEFMQHLELYHDGVEVLEKKLIRLIDALQKDDLHKIKLAVANMVNKDPFLKREFESLCLEEKPHQSLFMCEEDFDDITEPLSHFESRKDDQQHLILPQSANTSQQHSVESIHRVEDIYKFEHFSSKVSKEELSYASQNCPCKCHATDMISTDVSQIAQHCGGCSLKFMRGRMYLVNKIKPILAEWSYIEPTEVQWTFEEDRDILEFCRCKAERSEETVSFDTQTFEELANEGSTKKSAREIAKRFNDLMDIYKDSIGHQIST